MKEILSVLCALKIPGGTSKCWECIQITKDPGPTCQSNGYIFINIGKGQRICENLLLISPLVFLRLTHSLMILCKDKENDVIDQGYYQYIFLS